jgi:hypothetical protein
LHGKGGAVGLAGLGDAPVVEDVLVYISSTDGLAAVLTLAVSRRYKA